MDTTEAFASVYQLVHALHTVVEALPGNTTLKEQCRRASRLAKRVEVLISDLQPYVGPALGQDLAQVLQDIVQALQSMKDMVQVIGSKGPLATFLQADRLLAGFQTAAKALETALSAITGRLPEETLEELATVKALLSRTRFDLPPKHADTMQKFRQGVDGMSAVHAMLMEACGEVLDSITGVEGSHLTKEGFHVAMKELMAEHQLLLKQGDPYKDIPYLRTMMDVMRLYHRPGEVPLAYVCPLTHQVMRDPVVLQETGQSYERRAIELWYSKGHKICPRSGKPLGWRLHLVPNTNLKEGIEQWRMYSALAVAWQPLLAMHLLKGHDSLTNADGTIPFINLEGSTSGTGGGMGAQLKSQNSTPASRSRNTAQSAGSNATPTALSSPAAWSLPPGAVLSPRSDDHTPNSPLSPRDPLTFNNTLTPGAGPSPMASESMSNTATPIAHPPFPASPAPAHASPTGPAPAAMAHTASSAADSSATKSSASSNPARVAAAAPLPPPPPPRASSGGGGSGVGPAPIVFPVPLPGSGGGGVPPLLPPPPAGRSSSTGGASPAPLSPPPPPTGASAVASSTAAPAASAVQAAAETAADPYAPIEFPAFPDMDEPSIDSSAPLPATTASPAGDGVLTSAQAAESASATTGGQQQADEEAVAVQETGEETVESAVEAVSEQTELEFRTEWAQASAAHDAPDTWDVPVPQPASLDSQTTVPYPAVCDETSPTGSEEQSAAGELEFGALEEAANLGHPGRDGDDEQHAADSFQDAEEAAEVEQVVEAVEVQQQQQQQQEEADDLEFGDLAAADPPAPAPASVQADHDGDDDDDFSELMSAPPAPPAQDLPATTTTVAAAASDDDDDDDAFGDLVASPPPPAPTAAPPPPAALPTDAFSDLTTAPATDDDGFDDFLAAPAPSTQTQPAANGGFDQLLMSFSSASVQLPAAGAAAAGDDGIEWGDMSSAVDGPAAASKASAAEVAAAGVHTNGTI